MSIVLSEFAEVGLTVDATQASGGAVAGILNACKIHLYTNAHAPTPTSMPADFTEPTYTGYAAGTLTWAAGVRDSTGNIVTLSSQYNIQETTTPVAVTILGWFITDAGGTHFLMGELLSTPLSLVDLLSFYGLIIPFAPGVPSAESAIVVS